MRTIQSNYRLRSALAAVRILRDPATMAEVYDALNARHRARHAHVTSAEAAELRRRYLAANAPDLLRAGLQP